MTKLWKLPGHCPSKVFKVIANLLLWCLIQKRLCRTELLLQRVKAQNYCLELLSRSGTRSNFVFCHPNWGIYSNSSYWILPLSDGLYNWVQRWGNQHIWQLSCGPYIWLDEPDCSPAYHSERYHKSQVHWYSNAKWLNRRGIFAVAFTTALANGEPPGALIFNQPEMRKHLMECLELQLLSAFPIMRKRRRANKVKLVSPVPIYCSCRMPEQAGNTLIQCSTCKEWFAVPPEAFDSGTRWFCNNCT